MAMSFKARFNGCLICLQRITQPCWQAETYIVRRSLRDCAAKAEELCGYNSLLAINSLAILGRFPQEQNLYSESAEVFKDAIRRLEPCDKVWEAYKLENMQRLAIVENKIGSFGRSGLLLLDVFNGRRQIFGPDHAYAAGVLQQLRDHLMNLAERQEESWRTGTRIFTDTASRSTG